jgi:glycosyltransferase involved in cell wall biosynthesis
MKLYRLYERRALTTVNMINLVSSVDFYSLSREAPELPLINICNGVDSSKFTPDEVCRIPGRLLFTGNFEYAPNAEAARHLALYILPQIRRVVPSATLQIVGRNPPPEIIAQPGVIATGFVEDITSCYRNSQVFVCFLLSGAGVKNKVLEAMSSGLPVVTTQLGIDGIDHLEVGRHYLLANDAQSYVQLVVDALGNQNLRNYLAQEARVVMAKHFSWSIIAKRYYTAFGLLAESPG